jgi:hypothetical protein
MNDLTTSNNNFMNADDGWGDAAAENAGRVLRGTLLKFSEGTWSKGAGAEVKDGTQLVALGTVRAWVKWVSGKPAKYEIPEAGRSMPEREDLGDLDEDAWEAGVDGKPKDPWQNTRFVHLVDPLSAEIFTFSTSSWGGRGAVADLAEQIQRVRYANPGALPVVELSAAPMMTKFGKKSKPLFKVVEWRKGGSLVEGDEPPLEIAHSSTKHAKAIETAKSFDDDIPF